MIVTVTLNTAIDKTLSVPNFRLGRRHRTVEQTTMPGGKGVNVARVLAKHGHRTTAILPAGSDAQRMIALLEPQKVRTFPVPITGSIRTNIAVVEQDGTTTKLNEPGATLSARELSALLNAVEEHLATRGDASLSTSAVADRILGKL